MRADLSAEMRIEEAPIMRTETSKRTMKQSYSAKTKSTALTSHHSRIGLNDQSHSVITKYTNAARDDTNNP